jgi:phage tail-like protein
MRAGQQIEDPLVGFYFAVEIDKKPVANFSEVTGLGGEIEVEEYKEGGMNEFVYKLPKITKYNNLVLKRGMTKSMELYDWFNEVASGTVRKKEVAIHLKDFETDSDHRVWRFVKAFPVKLSSTDLNSQSSTILIETLELVHRGITK